MANYLSIRQRGEVFASLTVHLAKNNVDGSDNRDDISHKRAHGHFLESLEIKERRGPDANTIGLQAAIAHYEVAQLTLWSLYGNVGFANGGFQDLRHAGKNSAGRNP